MRRGGEDVRHLRLANGGAGDPNLRRQFPISALCYIFFDWGTCIEPDECGFDFGDCPNKDICLVDY